MIALVAVLAAIVVLFAMAILAARAGVLTVRLARKPAPKAGGPNA